MPAMGELGNFVRQRRRELGYTLEELADLTGISHQAVSQIELGKARGMRSTTAFRLARALQVSADDLLERLPDAVAV